MWCVVEEENQNKTKTESSNIKVRGRGSETRNGGKTPEKWKEINRKCLGRKLR